MFGTLSRFWRFVFRGRVLQVILLLLIMCLAAVMEMATLAAVLPLVGSLVNAQDGATELIASYLPASLGQSEHLQSMILIGVVIIVCLSAALRILVLRMSAEFSATMGLHLQTQYFRIMLSAQYEEIVNESSSQKLSLMTTKIPYINSVYLLGALNLTTSLISAIGIVVMLVWLSTGIVFVALFFLTIAYVLVAYFSRRKLRFYGKSIAINNPRSVQYLQDSLGGIRDVIMGSSQSVYVDRFETVAEKVETGKARLVFYSGFPRPILEAFGISAIAAITYFVNKGSTTDTHLLPMLGAFSLGLLRLLPYIQQIFAQWSKMYHAQPMFNDVVRAMNNFEPIDNHTVSLSTEQTAAVSFDSRIKLDNADFNYLHGDLPVLKQINLTINKGDYVGIVGPTGSGKSTLVDLLMGLLTPTQGALLVDGVVIDESNRHQWRRKVAHVPQRVYLADGTIEENIAFAVADDQINQARVCKSAERAHISEYIESLPDKYQTRVGENGVRLSGGQRQRLGIARALYAQCEVLVFDEATNALDKDTEQAIINELLNLSEYMTIIAIAHNNEAVKHCRQIVRVADGQAVLRTQE